jgi:proline iminopeptidase
MTSLQRQYTRLFAAIMLVCLLLPLAASRSAAFDEDHKEQINGTVLHFRVRGTNKQNPYLLILHGGPGFSAHMFYPWGPSLEKVLNVVYLDQRGCGESTRYKFKSQYEPKPEEIKDLTVANLVKDIEGVREFLKVDRWFVLGHSWGGMLGIEYVAAFPDHIVGFIDMDGAISFARIQDDILANCAVKFAQDAKSSNADTKQQGEALLEQTKKIQAMRSSDPLRMINASALALGPGNLYFAGDQPKAFAAFMAKIQSATQPYHIPPADLGQSAELSIALIVNDGLPTRDVSTLLPKITVPTLILNGKQDGVVTPGMAQVAHDGIKGSTLTLLDNCGHFPFIEQPEKTTAAVLNFVKKAGGRVEGR